MHGGRTEQVYDYKVLASRPIKQKQITFIQNHADSIVSQISFFDDED